MTQSSPGARLNRAWRIVATGFSFVVFGLGAFVTGIGVFLFLYLLPVPSAKKRHWARATVRRATSLYIAMMRGLGLLSWHVEHPERFRDLSGHLVIANHPSLLDAVFLMSLVPNACCIVKAAMARNPLTSAMVQLAGYIPNSVAGEALVERASAELNAGSALIIFPEGTRTRDPEQLKFHRGAANIALHAQCGIQPIAIRCTPPTLRKHEPWYEVPPTPPCFEFTALLPTQASALCEADSPPGIQARVMTENLRQQILNAL